MPVKVSVRWVFRSMLRLQGYRFVKLMQKPLITPTLQMHGALDTAMLPRTAQGSGNSSLYAVSINGGAPRRMPTPVGGSDPSWSPLNN